MFAKIILFFEKHDGKDSISRHFSDYTTSLNCRPVLIASHTGVRSYENRSAIQHC